ncbi:DUF4189 domain-containing protein [Acinetobacter courvalinii]|uniref:DUF4189 domain-containing protein n=1 Tax=Acinetobacter courvalinii TaxID=280147 RepID=UPI0037099B69
MRSKRQAEKAALTECRAKGGKKCEVDLAYYNQCAVMVTGDNSYLSRCCVERRGYPNCYAEVSSERR